MKRLRVGMFLALMAVSGRPAHSDANPPLAITPAKLEFGQQALNSESQPALITLVNGSASPVTFNEIISSGIDFMAKNDCGPQLAPGAQCAIQVVFKPVISGERMGVVEIIASDSTVPHFVTLGGIGQ